MDLGSDYFVTRTKQTAVLMVTRTNFAGHVTVTITKRVGGFNVKALLLWYLRYIHRIEKENNRPLNLSQLRRFIDVFGLHR